MSSKKASFESRDPSYKTPDSAGNGFTKQDGAVDFGNDAGAPIDWKTTDEPVAAKDLLAQGNPLTPGEDASDKGSFYARDMGSSAKGKTLDNTKKPYTGKERRRLNRRARQDRRCDIRFELDKSDRRKNSGRRESDSSPTFR
ncbi:hypothetical protein OAN12_04445 [Halioglobus sp.]|nr:hypothetical protein [Halioglobus sp.]